jgi:hypothetical protein
MQLGYEDILLHRRKAKGSKRFRLDFSSWGTPGLCQLLQVSIDKVMDS